MTPALSMGLRAGFAVGVLRAFWVAAEHFAGIHTAHLEWVEPSYGVFLLVGVPAVWVALSKTRRRAADGKAAWWAVGLTAGLLAGLLHTAMHGAYSTWVNPDYLESFASWNAATTANTLEVARREFSLPAFMDVLVGHPLAVNLAMAWASSKRLM
ncbi:MAG: hypothetical protein ACPG56_08505 [Flavobacteriales bacterium]